MEEIWKDIPGYETLYQVSNFGRVKALSKIVTYSDGRNRHYEERILVETYDGGDYPKITLTSLDKSHKQFHIHRLVALVFVDNPNQEAFNVVNHKDENKKNNHCTNLEWCDITYNNRYSHTTEKLNERKKKAVDQYTLDGKFIKTYSGAREAARCIGLKTHKHICECCNGVKGVKSAGGFLWKWA